MSPYSQSTLASAVRHIKRGLSALEGDPWVRIGGDAPNARKCEYHLFLALDTLACLEALLDVETDTVLPRTSDDAG